MSVFALSAGQQGALELIKLAQEKSPSKRLALLRRISDDFAEATSEQSTTARYLLDEIVSRIVGQLHGEERVEASSSLSRMSRLPEDVARALASDEDIAVARPILQDYSGLSQTILVDVANTGSQAHLQAMAGRSELASDVTDIVVQRGDRRVVRTLAANHGARFSRFGLRTLIDKAEQDATLQELIVDRCDLSFEAVGRLLLIVSQELAGRLRGGDLEFSAAIVQEQVVSWMSDRKKGIDKVNHFTEGIRRGTIKLHKAVLDLVCEQKLLDAATVIANCDLDRDYAFNLVMQGKTENVLLLLVSVELPWPAAEAFLKLRMNKLGANLCGPMVDEVVYNSIDPATAQRVMRFLKVRRAALSQQHGARAQKSA